MRTNEVNAEKREICGKRCRRFMCTLDKGHKGGHGRQYRRNESKKDGGAMNTTTVGLSDEAAKEWANKCALWDHIRGCEACQPGKPVETTDGGMQPTGDRCPTGRDLERAVYGN